jgi:hypothetical protein
MRQRSTVRLRLVPGCGAAAAFKPLRAPELLRPSQGSALPPECPRLTHGSSRLVRPPAGRPGRPRAGKIQGDQKPGASHGSEHVSKPPRFRGVERRGCLCRRAGRSARRGRPGRARGTSPLVAEARRPGWSRRWPAASFVWNRVRAAKSSSRVIAAVTEKSSASWARRPRTSSGSRGTSAARPALPAVRRSPGRAPRCACSGSLRPPSPWREVVRGRLTVTVLPGGDVEQPAPVAGPHPGALARGDRGPGGDHLGPGKGSVGVDVDGRGIPVTRRTLGTAAGRPQSRGRSRPAPF